MHDPEIKISDEEKEILSYFETHSPQKKMNNNMNHMIGKLRRCNIVKVKFVGREAFD